MDITDILKNLPTGDKASQLTKNVRLNTEKRRVARRAEEFVSEIIEYVANEVNYINNGLTYNYKCCSPQDNNEIALTSEEKDALIEELTASIATIPDKLRTSLAQVFQTSGGESKENKTAEEPKSEVEVVAKPAITFSSFNY